MRTCFRILTISLIVFFSLAGFTPFSHAEEKPESVEKDITDYLCKDVMRMTGEDRSVSLGILHGYMLGIKGTTKFNHQELLDITDRFIDNCLDNPKSRALDVFKKSYTAGK